LNSAAEELFMEINTGKTKFVAFRGKEPVRSKTCVSNRMLEQVNTLNYMGCSISYEGE
jgi:hypothetical protein